MQDNIIYFLPITALEIVGSEDVNSVEVVDNEVVILVEAIIKTR